MSAAEGHQHCLLFFHFLLWALGVFTGGIERPLGPLVRLGDSVTSLSYGCVIWW